MGLKAAPAHVCSATKPCNLAQARLGGKWGGKTPISRVDTEQHLYILMRYYQATKPEFLLKLHTDPATAALNTVTAYGEGYIEVNQVRFSSSVAFGPEGEVTEWPVESPADITSPLLHQAAGLTEPPPGQCARGAAGRHRRPPAIPAPRSVASPVGHGHRRRDHGHARRLPHLQHPDG
ncbi:hypothetical protein G6F65_014608 [Rhizopus arrhizus]|nr:hypothetical protein G6F65_014608 [Rhizopus arrhizus]